MNCQMGAWVIAADPQTARERLRAAQAFIEDIEARLSRFRSQSELSRLNTWPGRPVPVSPLLWEVLVWALEAAHHTDGLYDPTVLDALETAGYDRTFEEIVAEPADLPHEACLLRDRQRQARDHCGSVKWPSLWRDVRLEPQTRSVTLLPGTRLDLGGVAKGWAAERAADQLAVLGPCLVDAGGDIAARGAPPHQAGWSIGVADPWHPGADLALLLVKDRGVATSGVDYRRWSRDGAIQHHIIDPRTRRPAQTDLLSVTVVAPDAAQADLHALVALLLGAKEGHRHLARQPGVEGLLVRRDGCQLVTPGFEEYVFG